jgi:hypothetical protein
MITAKQERRCLKSIAKKVLTDDVVDHPAHYTDGGIETIDFIEAKKLNYNCGNAVKYISRAGKKAIAARAIDIAKALWYLQRELDALEEK